MPTHEFINKANAPDFVGKTFVLREGYSLQIMAFGKDYFMLRHKGASPFCKHLTEINRAIREGLYQMPKL